jgi:hypothetical protein
MNAIKYIENEHKYSENELYQIFGTDATVLLNLLKNKNLMDTNDEYDEAEMKSIVDDFFTDYNSYRKKRRSWINFI